MIIEIKVFVKLIYEILLFKKDMELLERTAKKLMITPENLIDDVRLK